MTERFLLVGSDDDWLEGLRIALQDVRLDAVPVRTENLGVTTLRQAAEAGTPTAAVVAAFPKPGERAEAATQEAIHAGDCARRVWPGLPLLFIAPVATRLISDYVRDAQPAQALETEDAGTLHVALARMRARRVDPSGPHPNSATVEVTVGVDAITIAVAVNGVEVVPPSPIQWSGSRKLSDFNKKFEMWKPIHHGWLDVIQDVGEWLWSNVGLLDNADVLADCVKRVGAMEHVHFRFSLRDDSMRHVPFELIWDPDKALYVRQVAPVARRVVLADRAVVRMPPARPDRATLNGPVLFIRSNLEGSLRVPGHTFSGKNTFEVERLRHLDRERDKLKDARRVAGLTEPEELDLKPGESALAAISNKLKAGPWDVVHFAGHSVRSDDGKVYLVLPGDRKDGGTRLTGMPVASFGDYAGKGQARLVILSSCESSSADTVFRLAQAGVPCAVGFRWEVNDEEAANFTSTLHKELALGRPLGRAFHAAVQFICASASGSPTFAAPILAVQEEQWGATPA